MISFFKEWMKERWRISKNKDMVRMFNMFYDKRRGRQEHDPKCTITTKDGWEYSGSCDFNLQTSFNGNIYIVDSHDILFMSMVEGTTMRVEFEDTYLSASLLCGYFTVTSMHKFKVPDEV